MLHFNFYLCELSQCCLMCTPGLTEVGCSWRFFIMQRKPSRAITKLMFFKIDECEGRCVWEIMVALVTFEVICTKTVLNTSNPETTQQKLISDNKNSYTSYF